jgi:hypothetical protein
MRKDSSGWTASWFLFAPPLAAVLLCLGGCSAPRQTAFNEADFAKTSGRGSGVVSGRAVAILNDHQAVAASGEVVAIVPVTPYTTENIQRRFVNGEHLQSADRRIDKYLRATTTDSEGNFAIGGLPAGEYYVQTEAQWTTSHLETDNDGIEENMHVDHEKLIYARISVRDHQTVRVTNWDQRSPIHDGFYAYGGTLDGPHHPLLD